MDKLQEYYEFRDTQMRTTFKLIIKDALDFMKLGIKNNPDFITKSCFGQMFHHLQVRDADFTMLQNNGNAFSSEEVDSFPEDAPNLEGDTSPWVFRQIERELMSDQLPLFIKTPNGRHKMGIKRDCYLLNPQMKNQDWMKCYQYIGSQVARIMCKDYLFWGVPMAPTFYMLAK